jgi:hypothetical protein
MVSIVRPIKIEDVSLGAGCTLVTGSLSGRHTSDVGTTKAFLALLR